jgi:hypothetical protein
LTRLEQYRNFENILTSGETADKVLLLFCVFLLFVLFSFVSDGVVKEWL